ncbi:MAG: MBL fold metallo-hydrolase [Pseudomonadota bacterium]|nr:MBL fold metallo-hydrolase [Pseudomonadota bacterium]
MSVRNLYLFFVIVTTTPGLLAQEDFVRESPAPGNLRFTWIHGSVSAKANTDVRIQVHRYNEHTYILRQNPAIHWEAPFMYLLMGNERAVLLDTGATEEEEFFPLRETVDKVLRRWSSAQNVETPELLVLPLGSDQSQTAALAQFANKPYTTVMAPGSGERASLVTQQQLDLGGRVLSVIPTPGLDASSITLYDPWGDLLLTGNAFYPGRLVIRDFQAYRNSLDSLVQFMYKESVSYVFGGRIEMTNRPGLDHRLRSNYRPGEHSLQLEPQLLETALQAVNLINGETDIRILDDFILMNGVGRGARDWGFPVYIPEAFTTPNTR